MEQHNEIDLGQTNYEMYGGSPMAVETKSDDKDKKRYPSFHYSGPKDLDLPDDGEMTVDFCVVSKIHSVRDGKEHYECTVEIRSLSDIMPEEDDEDAAPMKVEDILDGLMAKLQKEKE